jgi:hypothetical protein
LYIPTIGICSPAAVGSAGHGGKGMSEASVNGLFSVVAIAAEAPPARRRPLKIVDESAAMIGSPGSLCVLMVRKDSARLDEVRAAAGDTCPVVRVDRNRARRCPEEPGLADCRLRIGSRLPTCCCRLAIHDRCKEPDADFIRGHRSLPGSRPWVANVRRESNPPTTARWRAVRLVSAEVPPVPDSSRAP